MIKQLLNWFQYYCIVEKDGYFYVRKGIIFKCYLDKTTHKNDPGYLYWWDKLCADTYCQFTTQKAAENHLFWYLNVLEYTVVSRP